MRNYEKELNPILFSEFLNCFSVANIIDQNVNVNVNVNVKLQEGFPASPFRLPTSLKLRRDKTEGRQGSGFWVQRLEGEEVHGFGRIRWG